MYDTPPPPDDNSRPPPHGHPYGALEGQSYGYNPHLGYGPPGVPPGGPTGPVAQDDRTWALAAYLGTLVVGLLAPLIVYLAKRNDSRFIRHHAAQSLNFQLTVAILTFVPLVVLLPIALATDTPVILALIIPIYLGLTVAQYVLLILASIRTGRSEFYRMPTFFCFRMVR